MLADPARAWIPLVDDPEGLACSRNRPADDAVLHRVRVVMTRWMALVGCVLSIPVVGVVLVQRPAGWNLWVTVMMCSLFPAALLLLGRHPRVAGQLVSLLFFTATAIGGYLNLGSGVITINIAYAACVIIASACWSSIGSFGFALSGGAMATYAAHVHFDISPLEANVAGAKVTVLLLVLAGVQHGLMTALVRARGRMLAHEERMESLIRESPEGMLVLDAERRIRLANPSAATMIGQSTDALLGTRLEALSWLDDASLERLKSQWGRSDRSSHTELRGHGNHQIVESTLSTLTRSEGDWRYLLVLRDVTAKRADEQAHEELQRRVRESTALESLGRLAGGIAHDFNNLLTVILNTTELAAMHDELPDDLAHDLTTVQTATLRAAELTGQLLAVARRQVMRPVVLCPNQVVKDLLPLLERLLPENVDLRLHCAEDLGNVAADPTQLGQVLVNLVTNAVDAMSEGGKLTIETNNATLDTSYAAGHPDVEAGEYLQLTISDTGGGMSETTLSRIFEPFFTTKAKERGTGLGLATVHGIIRQSGGHVHVYSEPREGTTFRVYLPRVAEPPVAHTQERAPETRVDAASLRVLLVEDQEQVRTSIHRMLVHLGYRVWDADQGEVAVSRYAERANDIDLLLTDVVMPGLSGPELAAVLRDRNPDLRVLYMSGYTENALVHHAALGPGVDYLAKPFDLRTLREALARVSK